MGKKGNTVLFMLIATVINVLIMSILFIIGMIIIGFVLTTWPSLGESSLASGVMVILLFVGATAGTFFIYNKGIKWAAEKYKLEDKLYPFMAPRGRRPPQNNN